jgi:hypothetical protein
MPGIGSDPNQKVSKAQWLLLWIWGGIVAIATIATAVCCILAAMGILK